MSKEVDQRVVQMQFDNAQFERGAKESLSTIDKLKSALNFSGLSSGMSEISKNVNKLDFSGMTGALDVVGGKFSALETIAVGALINIGKKAEDTAERLVKSLSIDQVTAGWSKYAEKTTSVQTIMAATSQTWEKEAEEIGYTGEQMEFVNSELEKLNWFTDETSYNFTDMVNNIGKFTSAGVGLDTSVKAMEGIANWAAISGQNAQAASRAMYNLAQALGTGSVKLIDWKSIENANMATQEFKQTVIQVAEEVGTLKKAGDGVWKTLEGNEVSVTNFNENLKDAWFNSEVLMKSLDQYGAFSTVLYEASDAFGDFYDTTSELLDAVDEYKEGTLDLDEIVRETGMSAEKATEWFDTLSDSAFDLGRKAFRAGQEAKTFEEAIDATKDAVSTGWMNTFEIILGNYEEAKRLWTDVANELWEVFAGGAQARNDLLKEWKSYGGRDRLLDGISNSWENFKNILATVKDAFHDIFPEMNGSRLLLITNMFVQFTEKLKLSDETLGKVKSSLKGAFAVLDIIKQAITAVFKALPFDKVKNLSGFILDSAASLGDYLTALDEAIKEHNVFGNAIDKFKTKLSGLKDILTPVVDILKKAKNAISDFLRNLFGFSSEGVNDPFAPFTKMGESIAKLKENLAPLSVVGDTFKAFFGMLGSAFSATGPIIKTGGELILNTLKTVFDGLKGILLSGDYKQIFDVLNGGILTMIGLNTNTLLKTMTGSISLLPEKKKSLVQIFDNLKESVLGFIKPVQKEVDPVKMMDVAKAMGILAISLIAMASIDPDRLGVAFTALTGMFIELGAALKVMSTTVAGSGAVSKLQTDPINQAAGAMVKVAAAVAILALSLKSISKIDPERLTASLGALSTLLVEVVGSAVILSKYSKKISGVAGTLIALSVSMKIMASALKSISEIEPNQMLQAIGGFTAIIVEVTAMIKYLSQDVKVVAFAGKIAAALLIISGAMVLFASSLKIIASIDADSFTRSMIAMVGFFGAAIVTFKALSKNSKSVITTAASILIFANALTVMSVGLKVLGSMSLESIGKALLALAGTMVIFVAAFKSFNSVNALASSGALILLSAGLVALSVGLRALGSINLKTIVTSIATLAATLVVFAGLSYVLAPIIPIMTALAGVMALVGAGALALGIGLTAIAASGVAAITALVVGLEESVGGILIVVETLVVGILKIIKDSAVYLYDAAKALLDILIDLMKNEAPAFAEAALVMVDEILKSLVTHGPNIVDSLLSFIISVVQAVRSRIPEIVSEVTGLVSDIMGELGNVLGGMSADDILKGEVIAGLLAGLVVAFKMITPMIPEAMLGLLGVAGLVAELAAIIAAFGALSMIPGAADLIASGGSFLQVIGTAIGQFIGGLAGGIAEGFSASLPAIGSDLSAFMENAQGFIDGAKGIDAATVEGVKNLAAAMLLITGTELLEGITAFITGGNSVGIFGEQLEALAPHIVAYADAVKGVDASAVEASASAIKMLAEAAALLPNEGGVLAYWVGENQLSQFGEELEAFAPKLASYAKEVKSVKAEDVEGSANAIKMLAEAAKELPNEGGVLAYWVGENALSDFGMELKEFGPKIAYYAKEVKDVKAEDVEGSSNAIKILAEAANSLPNEGGAAAFWMGDNTLSRFGEELVSFGPHIKDYAGQVSSITAASLESSTLAIKMLSEVATNLPESGGLRDKIFGSNSLSDFGKELKKFGPYIKKYAETVSGIGFTDAQSSAAAARLLASLANELPSSDGMKSKIFGSGMSLSDFGKELEAFGPHIKRFAEDISDIPTTVGTNSRLVAYALQQFIAEIPSEGGIKGFISGSSNLKKFGEELESFAPSFKSFADNISGLPATVGSDSRLVAYSLQQFSAELPTTGGLASKIFGSSVNLSDLGAELEAFAVPFKNYAMNLRGIESSNVEGNSETAAKAIKALRDNLPDNFVMDAISGIGDKLVKFGESIATYASKLANINTNNLMIVTTQITRLADISKSLNNLDATKLKEFAQALKDISNETVSSFIDNFTEGTKDILKKASGLVDAIAKGINDRKANLLNKVYYLCRDIVNKFKASLSTNVFYSIGSTNIMQALINGMNSQAYNANINARNISVGILNTFSANLSSQQFYNLGANCAVGLANGMANTNTTVAKASSGIAKTAYNNAKNTLQVASPSKLFTKLGEFSGMGLVNGLNEYTKQVGDAGTNLGNSAIDSLKRAVQNISELTEDELGDVTITPVLDLSEIQNGYNDIGAMFSRNLAVSGTYGNAQMALQRSTPAAVQTAGSSIDIRQFETLVGEVRQLRANLGEFTEEMSNFQVVMDTGALVGQMSSPLNSQMGAQAARYSRR